MKYVFRGIEVFTYDPKTKQVTEGKVHDTIPAFNYCSMIPEDYKLLSEFFDTVYRHISGESVELKDIKVN